MNLMIQPEAPPLRVDHSGAIRVGQTQVLLEIVIRSHLDGASPEEIVRRFPALEKGDVYSVLGYYFRHTAEVETYLREGDRESEQVWKKIDERQGDLGEAYERLAKARKQSPTPGNR